MKAGRHSFLFASLIAPFEHVIRFASTMGTWTEREVIEKLNEGWLLSGDVGADAPFALINPGQVRADSVPRIEFEIVRALHEKGVLVPAAVPGKKMMYRRNPR